MITYELQKDVHELAKRNGFWPSRDEEHPFTYFASKLALVHSEVSEALEVLRAGGGLDFDKLGEEMADAVIRLMDLAHALGIDLAQEVVSKHEKNKHRPFRHGKAF